MTEKTPDTNIMKMIQEMKEKERFNYSITGCTIFFHLNYVESKYRKNAKSWVIKKTINSISVES